MLEKINKTIEFLGAKGFATPDVGIILGTGLGGLTSKIENCIEIDYSDIPHFPVPTVEGHEGKLIYGDFGQKKIPSRWITFLVYRIAKRVMDEERRG